MEGWGGREGEGRKTHRFSTCHCCWLSFIDIEAFSVSSVNKRSRRRLISASSASCVWFDGPEATDAEPSEESGPVVSVWMVGIAWVDAAGERPAQVNGLKMGICPATRLSKLTSATPGGSKCGDCAYITAGEPLMIGVWCPIDDLRPKLSSSSCLRNVDACDDSWAVSIVNSLSRFCSSGSAVSSVADDAEVFSRAFALLFGTSLPFDSTRPGVLLLRPIATVKAIQK